MADLDAELAALEAEVEKENKAGINQKEVKKTNPTNKQQNYGNNIPQSQPKNAYVNNNYNGYGNEEAGLENFLNSNDTNNTKQNNNNYNNYNYNYQNNTNNNYYNKNYDYNNYNNYNNYNANKTNNYNNNYYNNNSNYNQKTNNYYNNNNYNDYYNPNKYNNYQNNPKNVQNNPNNNYPKQNQNQFNYNQSHTQIKQKPQNQNQYNYNQPQNQVKPKPQNQNQTQPKMEIKKSSKTQVISKSKGLEQEPKEDIYPSTQEKMYHKLKEMKSLTVLEEEIALCDKIIAFKKNRGLDYDDWETKKDLAQMQLSNTKSLIESGDMDFEAYKKLILGELAYEKKILKFTESDKKSKPYELAEIKRRIEQRINVISKELTQNIEESTVEDSKQDQKTVINNNNNSNNQNKEPNDNPRSSKNKTLNNSGNKATLNPKTAIKPEIPQDSNPEEKPTTQIITNTNKNKLNPHTQNNNIHPNQIPKQYIIQKKVLVTDPKTGKQMYVMKNIVDPNYEKYLKQKEMQSNQNQNKIIMDSNPKNQHIIQQKVLVTDPKTGKQMYVMKNVVDPKYSNQANKKPPTSNMKPKTEIKQNPKIQEQIEAQNKIKEEIKKYQLYINTLIKEYTEAKEYFKRNGQEQLANKSRKDLQILISAKQKVDMGRYKEVKLNLLPKTITPEYIFGYSINERMEKFKTILSQLIKDKNEIDEKMKSILEKLKKLKRKELEKAKEQVKPKLDEMKLKKENIIKLMDGLKEKFKDKWTPAPEFSKVIEEEKIEKVSYEGAIFGLKIKVGNTNYDKDQTFLKLRLEANKNKILTKVVELKQMGDYNEEWKWDFNEDEFKNISRTFLYVELFRHHTFSDDKKGEGKVDLGNIRKGIQYKCECKIEIESKRVEPIVMFLITPITPEGKKYYETIQKEKIKITKIYPAFTGKQQIDLPSDKNKETTNPQPNPQNQQKTDNSNNNKTNTAAPTNQPKLDKNKFRPEELEDVDIIDNLNTLKVLEFKIKELEAKIKKIDGRTPREMLQKKVKMTCKKKQIEEGMGDGSISPKDYMELMKVQLEHDQLLALYMKQNNEEEKAKIIMGRIVLIKQEIDELKSFIK